MAFSGVPITTRSSTFQMAFNSIPMVFSIHRRSKSSRFGEVQRCSVSFANGSVADMSVQRCSVAFFSVLRRPSAFFNGRMMGELRSTEIADGSVATAILVVYGSVAVMILVVDGSVAAAISVVDGSVANGSAAAVRREIRGLGFF
uniref:Uncharacterized protein n=1 Tax=Cucumis melo TaxID=3656 RepID=A0A9I9DN38_CUCME